jgi:hypothetical protein
MKFSAKNSTLIRFIASIILFIIIIYGLFIIDFFLIINWYIYLILLFNFNLWLILSLSLKFEFRFFRKNFSKIIISISTISLVLFSLLIVFLNDLKQLFIIIILIIKGFFMLYTWHSCLSIYKRIKKYSIIAFLITIIANLSILLLISPDLHLYFTMFTFLIIYVISYLLIIIIELLMMKKGYLKYI